MAGILAKARVAVVEATGIHGEESWASTMGETWSQDSVKDLLRLAGQAVTFAPEPDYVPAAEPLSRPHPDADLMEAAQIFLAAEMAFCETCWAEDHLDHREDDRAAALARRAAAEAEQGSAAKVLTERKATTLAGFESKAKAAVAWYGDTPPDDGAGGDILWSLACDLAGEA
jgi:hypothetical protein